MAAIFYYSEEDLISVIRLSFFCEERKSFLLKIDMKKTERRNIYLKVLGFQ